MIPQETLSTRQAALRAKLQAPEKRGRPAVRREWSNDSPIEKLRSRIGALRAAIRRAKRPVPEKHEELALLTRIRRHQRATTRHVRRMRVHRATTKGRQVKAEARRLEKDLREATNREQKRAELLAEWQTSLPGGEGSSADRFAMMRPNAIYRWRDSVRAFCKVESYIRDLCGPQSGDIRRQPFHLTEGEMFDGASWAACEDAKLRRVMKERATIIQSTQTEKPKYYVPPADVPRLDDMQLHGPWAMSYAEIEQWKLSNWPGYSEWLAAQSSLATQPQGQPTDAPDDLFLSLCKFARLEISTDELRHVGGDRLRKVGGLFTNWVIDAQGTVPVDGSIIGAVIRKYGDTHRSLETLELLGAPCFEWEIGYGVLAQREIGRLRRELEI